MAKKGKAPRRSSAPLVKFVDRYLHGIADEFAARWDVWPIAVDESRHTEVIVGLLRRQYSLAVHLARAPMCWTADFAPIILRCMVEVHLWMAWILEKPEERATLFVEDGIGKEKLMIMHRSDELKALGLSVDDDAFIQESMAWVESQRYSFLVDVNLSGSWSGIDTRKMAEEANCRDFYRFIYPVFSTAVHSTWNHIAKIDLCPCDNPLHAHHRVPRLGFLPASPGFLELVAKYLDKTFRLVDAKLGLMVQTPSTYDALFSRPAAPADRPRRAAERPVPSARPT